MRPLKMMSVFGPILVYDRIKSMAHVKLVTFFDWGGGFGLDRRFDMCKVLKRSMLFLSNFVSFNFRGK